MSEIKKTSLFESIVSTTRITTAIFIIVVIEIIRYSWVLLPIVLYILSTIINIPIFIILTIEDSNKRRHEHRVKQTHESNVKRVQENERYYKQIHYLDAVRSKRMRDLDQKYNPEIDKCVKQIHRRGDFNIIKNVKQTTEYLIHFEELHKAEEEHELHRKRMRDLETDENRDIINKKIMDYHNKVSIYDNNKLFR